MDRIFESEEVAKAEIPVSKTSLLQLNGLKTCLVHPRIGFYVVAGACPHLGESLSKGTTNYLNEVICPWGSYRSHLISGAECKHRIRDAQTFPVNPGKTASIWVYFNQSFPARSGVSVNALQKGTERWAGSKFIPYFTIPITATYVCHQF